MTNLRKLEAELDTISMSKLTAENENLLDTVAELLWCLDASDARLDIEEIAVEYSGRIGPAMSGARRILNREQENQP